MKPGIGSLKKINKIDKPLARLFKRERTQINKITNETGEITTNTIEIYTIVREYEKLYVTKSDNLEETDKFLETCKLPKQTEINRKLEQSNNQQRN